LRSFAIIDAHVHLGVPVGKVFARGCELRDVLHRLDRLGIERAYSSHQYWLDGRFAEAVEASMIAYDESSGRLPFLGVYDPRDERASLRAIDSCAGHDGFIGIKIHPSLHGTSAEDPRYEPAWRYARQHRLAILSHTWNASSHNPSQWLSLPKLFEKYLDKYQDVEFVMGHSGGRGSGHVQAVAVARKYPNVYLDVSGDIFSMGLICWLVEAVGADRVLFGSDQPWIDPTAHLARIMLAEITEEAKRLILRDNALRVYQQEYPEEKQ